MLELFQMERSFANVLRRKVLGGRPFWPLVMLAKYLRIKAARARNAPLCVPIFASLSVTKRCNSRCGICRLGGDGSPRGSELSAAELKRLAEELKEAGTEVIGVTGGEPLLRPDIFEIFSHIKGLGLGLHLSTNGSLLDEDAAARLLDSGPDWVNVSVDGVTAATHDALRGVRAFEDLKARLRNFVRLRDARRSPVRLNLVMVLNALNLEEAPELPALGRELGADAVGFMPFHMLDLEGPEAAKLRVRDLGKAGAALARIFEAKRGGLVQNTDAYLGLFERCFRGEPSPVDCYAMYSSIAVDPEGGVYPCFPKLQLGEKLGSLRGGSLKDFLKSPALARGCGAARNCRYCYWNCHTELNLVFNGLARALLGR